MSKRDFLALEDWTADEVEGLLALAGRIKRGEITGGLERKVLAMVFMDPSLRTRTSFETAMYLHGGHAVVLEPGKGSWPLETELGAVMDGDTVEHIVDAARVLGRYADALGLRSFPRGSDWTEARKDLILRNFARYCDKPVINLESARRHPCQALADAMTLREKLGDTAGKRFVLTWAWHPKALPTAVPASAALAAARLGMEIVIGRPEGYELDPEDTALVRRLTQETGGEFVHIIDDPDDALVGADAVYVKSWGSVKLYGKPQEEAALRAGLRDWRLTPARLRGTRGGKGIVMHCLPVRRNVEIDDAVLDGPNSVVVEQAENRLHAQRALLLELLGRSAA
ncbi:MAG TPA: N-acetylornithine carbamoyltransferase [Gemmatimonadales bacterium]|nr:N-acetylornithine carbamoyltransferase [Gemmatimonadales bacterium]